MFESTADDPSISCRMTPAPSLFAEPSSPSARYGRSVSSNTFGPSEVDDVRYTLTWFIERRSTCTRWHCECEVVNARTIRKNMIFGFTDALIYNLEFKEIRSNSTGLHKANDNEL